MAFAVSRVGLKDFDCFGKIKGCPLTYIQCQGAYRVMVLWGLHVLCNELYWQDVKEMLTGC